MTAHTNDIDGLLGYLSSASDRYLCYTIPFDVAANYRAALTALVAEQDALLKENVALRDRLKAQQDEVLDQVFKMDVLRKRIAQLESHPPADRDRDRELRERLVCAALAGILAHEGLQDYEKADTLIGEAIWFAGKAISKMQEESEQ